VRGAQKKHHENMRFPRSNRAPRRGEGGGLEGATLKYCHFGDADGGGAENTEGAYGGMLEEGEGMEGRENVAVGGLE